MGPSPRMFIAGLDGLRSKFRHRCGDPLDKAIFASINSVSKICDFGLGFIMQLGRLAVSRHPALADRMLELFEPAQKARNVVGSRTCRHDPIPQAGSRIVIYPAPASVLCEVQSLLCGLETWEPLLARYNGW